MCPEACFCVVLFLIGRLGKRKTQRQVAEGLCISWTLLNDTPAHAGWVGLAQVLLPCLAISGRPEVLLSWTAASFSLRQFHAWGRRRSRHTVSSECVFWVAEELL